MRGNKYVACNGPARRMFKKKGIKYLDSRMIITIDSLLKNKGVKDENDDQTKG